MIFHNWDGSVDWLTIGCLGMMAVLLALLAFSFLNLFGRK